MRVAITGFGAVSAVGLDADATWDAIRAGRTGIGPVTGVPLERLRVQIAAQVKGFDVSAHMEDKQANLMDRFAHLAVVAAREAMARAGLERNAERDLETAVIVGTGVGGQVTLDEQYRHLYEENATRVHPLTVPRLMVNAAASHISMDLGLGGPTFAVASACSSSNHAIGQAFHMVRSGAVPLALAGGAEACITLGTMKGWEGLRAMAPDTCRPFSRDRRGMVLGEGAALFVLEPLDAARARGARVWAELAGFGMSADAADLTQPLRAGAARAVRGALRDAGLAPGDVDYVNAHGTGTPVNDVVETAVLRDVFGAHADRLAVSSTKAVHGHAMGASGALELLAVVRALSDCVVPPTANFTVPDPECDLDYVTEGPRERRLRAAISNSFAFGGLNAVLALRAV